MERGGHNALLTQMSSPPVPRSILLLEDIEGVQAGQREDSVDDPSFVPAETGQHQPPLARGPLPPGADLLSPSLAMNRCESSDARRRDREEEKQQQQQPPASFESVHRQRYV